MDEFHAGRGLRQAHFEVSPHGNTAVTRHGNKRTHGALMKFSGLIWRIILYTIAPNDLAGRAYHE
jgi:hypothetical protein